MWQRPRLSWRDVALPALLAVVGVAEMASLHLPHGGRGATLEVLACLLLCWRRRLPLVVAPAAGVCLMAIAWVGVPMDSPATPIGIIALLMFSLSRWQDPVRGLWGTAAVLLVVWLTYVFADDRRHGPPDVIFVLALSVPPFVLGGLTRRLAMQRDVLQQNQQLVRQAAARDERDRIARELHDVIAHSVSAMVVQVAAAQELLGSQPDRARELLDQAATTGRQAVGDTGRLLHVLRDVDGELGLSPAPGLADLPDLVRGFRERGLAVQLVVDDDLPDLDPGVDVSAYRVVLEALTNAERYAADRAVSLRLGSSPSGLVIKVDNTSDGRTGRGSGLGLVGLAERVALVGGQLRLDDDQDGRFALDVVLPHRVAT